MPASHQLVHASRSYGDSILMVHDLGRHRDAHIRSPSNSLPEMLLAQGDT